MAAPIVDSTVPVSGATSVPVNTTISIIFDQEVDNYRLENGGIVLEGPDESKSIGPGYLGLYPPETDEDEFLASPGYKGIKNVDYTFQRVDDSGNVVPYYDYGSGVGTGDLYRTKVILTPKETLGELTEYTVYIIGDADQTDDYDFGVSSRTVFDTIKGTVTGNGEVVFYGGYTGAIRKRFYVEITGRGDVGTATYNWWTSTDAVKRSARTSAGNRLLEDGVKVRFVQDRTYEVGDSFSVWCDVPLFMSTTYKFSFTTSEHSIETLPTPSGIITGISSTSTTTSTFSVTETDPVDRDTLLPITTTDITITFSEALTSSTVTGSTVTVESFASDESIDGSVPYTGVLTKTLSVSGTTLTITLAADQLYVNNIVVVTLDSSIGSTSSNILGTDYEFFWGTTYDPFYAGTRHVRLRLGSVGSSIPDETINMAIWDASREVAAITPSTISDSAGYVRARTMYVVCLASWYLISGGRLSGGGERKRLADLDISRDSGVTDASVDDLKECFERYELALRSGGDAGYGASLRPLGAVKGSDDPDEPIWGRRWETPSIPVANARFTYSNWRRWYKTHKRRN
jgi:hypothetical protein